MEEPLARTFRVAEWLQPGLALEKAEPACCVKGSLGEEGHEGGAIFEGAMESRPEDPRLRFKAAP